MSGGKVISYVDAVNGMARGAMREDLAAALEPLITITQNLHGISLQMKMRLDEANERIAVLQVRVHALEHGQPPDGPGTGNTGHSNG